MAIDPKTIPMIVCTGNAHKVRELAPMLPAFELRAMSDADALPPETADTFEGNARIKARAGRASAPADSWVVADDSGLEVAALDGAPGVRSARYAGEDTTDRANLERLLAALSQHADRRARFVCVLIAIAPDGTEHVAHGTVDGRIANEPSGDGGFGYDPVFVPDGHASSFAELGDDTKAQLSHRAAAAASLRAMLEAAGS